MLRTRQPEHLSNWIDRARTSAMKELISVAQVLEKDKAAVQAALSLPYSNGRVEGHVHRLKLIKRQMYGRANFSLLRQRVLFRM